MKRFYQLTALAVALIIVAAGFVPAVAYGSLVKQYEEGIIEYNLQKSSSDSVQEWIDGELTRDAGAGSEWYIIALSKHGEYDFSAYKDALNGYLSENETGSASSRLKYALTYIAIGDTENPYIDKAIGNSIGEQGIMSLVFGLHLLNNARVSSDYSAGGLIDELLSLQLADGGFSVMGEYGDVDVTAMTVQALSVHYSGNSAVKSSVDRALDFLSARQLESGGFSGYGVANPESAAQVIIALSSLGIDACADSRFIKNGNTAFDVASSFRMNDGSFCHREGGDSDSTATAQTLCACVAYENMKNGEPPFYIFGERKKTPEESTSGIITTESPVTHTKPAATDGTTFSIESYSESATAAPTHPDTQKAEKTEAVEGANKTFRPVIISVSAAAVLLCTVLLIIKFRKGKHTSLDNNIR